MAAALFIAAVVTHSVSVLAEGVDTIIDIVASVSVLIGLRLATRHSRTFPMGLYKLENLIAIVIGGLILFGAYNLAREAIERISSGKSELVQPWLIIPVICAVIVCRLALARYKGRVGREENSPSLQADARHAWSDAVASVAILIGILLQLSGVRYMDSVVALVVVALLVVTGIHLTLEGLKVLLDASIEGEYLEKARSLIEADHRVRSVLNINGRNSGSYRFLTVSLVPWDNDLRGVEQMAADLEREIKAQIENVDQVVFEYETGMLGTAVGAIPLSEDRSRLPEGFSAPAFELIELDTEHGKEVSREMIEAHQWRVPGKDVRDAVMLARLGLDVVLTREAEPAGAAFEVLKANGVRTLTIPDASREFEAVQALRRYVAVERALEMDKTPSAPAE
jgi:cation diffusion facilitator family transporter